MNYVIEGLIKVPFITEVFAESDEKAEDIANKLTIWKLCDDDLVKRDAEIMIDSVDTLADYVRFKNGEREVVDRTIEKVKNLVQNFNGKSVDELLIKLNQEDIKGNFY